MAITNTDSGTRIDEVAAGIYRISTPFRDIPGGFSFNQYLVRSDQPLLFHTGPKRLGSLVPEAVSKVVPFKDLAFIAFSHYESDECGALNDFLTVAPRAVPLCSRVNAMVNGDTFGKQPRGLAHGDTVALGHHRVRWLDAPHLPHGWECGYLMEEATRTLLCGDLFTQGGADLRSDILEPSESFRKQMDYYSHTKNVHALVDQLAEGKPAVLACMHGSAWEGDGAGLLRALAEALDNQ